MNERILITHVGWQANIRIQKLAFERFFNAFNFELSTILAIHTEIQYRVECERFLYSFVKKELYELIMTDIVVNNIFPKVLVVSSFVIDEKENNSWVVPTIY